MVFFLKRCFKTYKLPILICNVNYEVRHNCRQEKERVEQEGFPILL